MGKRTRAIRIEPSPGTIIALLLLIAGLWVLNRLLPVVLVLVAALIIVGTISPAVRWLEERRIRRGLGIAIVFTALMVVTVLIITLTIPSLMAQATNLLDQEPALRARLVEWLAGSHLTSPLAELLRKVHSGDLVRMAASNVYEYSTRAIAIFAYILSSVFLALYIMIDRDRLRGGLFLMVPRSHHIRLSRVMLNLETIVGGYIRGQVITSAFMAIFVFILLKACGVANALAIAVFAGVADVLPYIGALLSVGAAVAAALSRGPVIIIVVLVLMLFYEDIREPCAYTQDLWTRVAPPVVRDPFFAFGGKRFVGHRRGASRPSGGGCCADAHRGTARRAAWTAGTGSRCGDQGTRRPR